MDKESIRIANAESAARLKRELKQLGLTQVQFAREIDMNAVTVNRWATGMQRPDGIVWAYLRLRLKIKGLCANE